MVQAGKGRPGFMPKALHLPHAHGILQHEKEGLHAGSSMFGFGCILVDADSIVAQCQGRNTALLTLYCIRGSLRVAAFGHDKGSK